MDLAEAKEILNSCVREELRDHAFGDVEVFWYKGGVLVANGYFSAGQNDSITFIFEEKQPRASFYVEEARELRNCGTDGVVFRNDTVGPDEFVEGQIMPGLTKEAILKELS